MVPPPKLYLMNIARRQHRHKRIRTRVRGTATRPRASVFRSATRVSVQLIDDSVGKTLVAVEKVKAQGTKTDQASVVGKEIAKKALAAGIKQVVFDRAGYKYHGRVKAVAEAMRQEGLHL